MKTTATAPSRCEHWIPLPTTSTHMTQWFHARSFRLTSGSPAPLSNANSAALTRTSQTSLTLLVSTARKKAITPQLCRHANLAYSCRISWKWIKQGLLEQNSNWEMKELQTHFLNHKYSWTRYKRGWQNQKEVMDQVYKTYSMTQRTSLIPMTTIASCLRAASQKHNHSATEKREML